MNSRIINITLFVSLFVVAFAYYRKDKTKQDHIDYMTQSLAELKQVLPFSSTINYRGIGSDPVNQWEVYLVSRYVLAPRVLGPAAASDTTLIICRNSDDSSAIITPAESKVLWEKRDSTYHYLLIKKDSHR